MPEEINSHNHWPLALARKFRTDLPEQLGAQQISAVAGFISTLYTTPLAVAGLVWLALVTDWGAIWQNGWLLLAFLGCMFLFGWLSFFMVVEIQGGYAYTDGALDSAFQWAAVFLLGPSALWLTIIQKIVYAIRNWWGKNPTVETRWEAARALSTDLATTTIAFLPFLLLYQHLGGTFPLKALSFQTIALTLAIIVTCQLATLLIFSGYIGYSTWGIVRVMKAPSAWPAIRFFLIAMILPGLANPFGIIIAGLFAQMGGWATLFFVAGLLLVALLARQLSRAAENTRQQSRQVEKLELLGRDLLNAPLDASALPELLKQHAPPMFSGARQVIWIAPDKILFNETPNWLPEIDIIWEWLHSQSQGQAFSQKDALPWKEPPRRAYSVVVAPILDMESQQPVGGIYTEFSGRIVQYGRRELTNFVAASQSLAAQIASSLHRAKVYADTLAHQRTLHEITVARQIQASFLPEHVPQLLGWDLAASLEPAREVSGDFYDFIPLSGNKLGLLIADVADKGIGPALYMALCRTLIRTYAPQFEAQPEMVLAAANTRILQDARASLFVTTFYGVLDTAAGTLVYANAGHNPPYLFCPQTPGVFQSLGKTGMPLGVDETVVWRRVTVQLAPGDVLLLYTDGLTDAQNSQDEFIDAKMMTGLVGNNLARPACELKDLILQEIRTFVGGAPQFDDMTVMVVRRDS